MRAVDSKRHNFERYETACQRSQLCFIPAAAAPSCRIDDAGVHRLDVDGKTASDVAAAAGKVFVNVPARRLRRALADRPFRKTDTGSRLSSDTRIERAFPFAARRPALPLCSSLITLGNFQGARAIRAHSCGR